MTETLRVTTSDEMSRKAFESLSEAVRLLGDGGRPVTWGLCGGRSVAAVYALLAASSIEFSKHEFFAVDERWVAPSSTDWNGALVKTSLIDPLVASGRIRPSQFHPFDATAPDALASYGRDLANHGGRFDILVLSMGEDGHMAALFPEHPSFDHDGESFIEFTSSPKPPDRRMSASRRLILASRFGLLLVAGDGKQGAWERFHDPALDARRVPSRLVHELPRSVIVTDRARP